MSKAQSIRLDRIERLTLASGAIVAWCDDPADVPSGGIHWTLASAGPGAHERALAELDQ